jgi:steroid delta-isomerase-like uncharacterized protein
MADEVCERNKELVRAWFEEVWNKGRSEAIDELFAADGVAHGLGEGGKPLVGPEGFKIFHAAYKGAFPDMRIEIDDIVAEGDMTAARFKGVGTHAGGHLGVPPTGKQVVFTAMSFTRWRDGQIVEGWNNVDMVEIFTQVGLMEAKGLS